MSGEETESLRQRRFFRRIPTGPRCKSCNAPEADAGEVIVSAQAAVAANLNADELGHRRMTLKGRSGPVDVVVLQPNQATDTSSA